MSDFHQPILPSAPQQAEPHQYEQLPPGYGQPQAQQQQQQHAPTGYGQPPVAYNPQYAQPPAQYAQQVHVPVYHPNVGPCAAGGGHSIKEEFTACGLVCGILLFPIGLICCLTMKDRTCLRCGMRFD